MKTTFKTLIAVLSLVFASCETEIPETDTTPPTFRFEITGDGFNRAFTEDDNFTNLQLNLKSNATYDLIFSGGDQGGLRRLQMELPFDYIDFQTDINSPWQLTDNGFTTTLSWNGDEDNPITGFVFTGTVVISGENVFSNFYFRAEDYGGESGPPFNISEGTLTISIADQQTELINL